MLVGHSCLKVYGTITVAEELTYSGYWKIFIYTHRIIIKLWMRLILTKLEYISSLKLRLFIKKKKRKQASCNHKKKKTEQDCARNVKNYPLIFNLHWKNGELHILYYMSESYWITMV